MAVGRAAARLSLAALLLLAGLLPAVAGEDARVRSGTGFFVSQDGFLLTSAHVVAGCPALSIWQGDESEHAGYVIASDRQTDVALLWAEGVRPHRAAAVAREPLRQGQEVLTLGFGVIATRPLQPVMIAGTLLGDSVAGGGSRVMLIRASLHAGHSGGALIAEDGSLLGMIIGRDEKRDDIGVAIPTASIEPLLAAYGIRLRSREAATEPRDLLGQISVLIQCSATAPEANAHARRR